VSTSIDDLLTTLDFESRRFGPKDPGDAARALERCARILNRLREDLPETDEARTRDDFTRRLADSCSQAGIAFEGAPGRLGDLVGVLGDAAGLAGFGLGYDERWAIAVRIATPARRLAAVIAASGPFADVPQLLAVADRSRELLRAAAVRPPRLPELSRLDRPITSTLTGRSGAPVAEIVEMTARLVSEFPRYCREPMTVRELVAIGHASSRVAEYLESAAGSPGEADTSTTRAWQRARDAVAMYSDGMATVRASFTTSRVIHAALAVDSATARAARAGELSLQDREVTPHEYARLRQLLQQIASASLTEFERIGARLFVSGGDTPLHEDRVGEWLRHETFRARPPDLRPGIAALQSAIAASLDMVLQGGREASRFDMVMQRH
jgi:hypothetical protein